VGKAACAAAEEDQRQLLLVPCEVEYAQEGEHVVAGIYFGVEFDAEGCEGAGDEHRTLGRGFDVDVVEAFSGRAAQGCEDLMRVFSKDADSPLLCAAQCRP
jgi:hypothetical protein